MMNGREKSDGLIVPAKPRNNAGRLAADAVEGRGPTEGNSSQQNASQTQCRMSASNALERVRQSLASGWPMASQTQGKSRMPQYGTSGSVRGAARQRAALPRSRPDSKRNQRPHHDRTNSTILRALTRLLYTQTMFDDSHVENGSLF